LIYTMTIMTLTRAQPQTGHAQHATHRTAPADLEALIAGAIAELVVAPDRARRVRAWQQMLLLIQSRTPERIAQMELEKGLRVVS
jgi:hypothetical protein